MGVMVFTMPGGYGTVVTIVGVFSHVKAGNNLIHQIRHARSLLIVFDAVSDHASSDSEQKSDDVIGVDGFVETDRGGMHPHSGEQ